MKTNPRRFSRPQSPELRAVEREHVLQDELRGVLLISVDMPLNVKPDHFPAFREKAFCPAAKPAEEVYTQWSLAQHPSIVTPGSRVREKKSTKLVFVYRVQYYCPTSGKLYWQMLSGFLGMPKTFGSYGEAQQACNSLIWQYHSARVIDGAGNVLYQV